MESPLGLVRSGMARKINDLLRLMERRRSQPACVSGGSILPGSQALASAHQPVWQSLRVRRRGYGLSNFVCNRRFTEGCIIDVGHEMPWGVARSHTLRVRRNRVI